MSAFIILRDSEVINVQCSSAFVENFAIQIPGFARQSCEALRPVGPRLRIGGSASPIRPSPRSAGSRASGAGQIARRIYRVSFVPPRGKYKLPHQASKGTARGQSPVLRRPRPSRKLPQPQNTRTKWPMIFAQKVG